MQSIEAKSREKRLIIRMNYTLCRISLFKIEIKAKQKILLLIYRVYTVMILCMIHNNYITIR